MFLSILFCITFTLLSKVSAVDDNNNAPSYSTLLDVQFLNETEEVKLSQNVNHKFEKVLPNQVYCIVIYFLNNYFLKITTYIYSTYLPNCNSFDLFYSRI